VASRDHEPLALPVALLAEMDLVLGVPGEWAGSEPLDPYVVKAGGSAVRSAGLTAAARLTHAQAWPPAAAPPPANLLTCKRCGRAALSLVLQARLRARLSAAPENASQVHAPLPDAPHRFLYLFCCLAAGCRNEADGWVGLRAQAAGAPAAPPPPPAPSAPPLPAPADDWGGGACDWEAGGGGVEAAGGYDAELAALSDQLSAAALASAAAGRRGGARPAAAPAPVSRPPRPPPQSNTLPEFYVADAFEPEAAAEPRGAAAAAAAARAEALAAALGGGEGGEAAEGGLGWGGEEYERSSVRGMTKALQRYTKRLARCPDQLLRYGAGGLEALWPSPQPPAPPPACPACGGPRRAEAQLMSPLLHFFSEGLPAGGAAAAEALQEWDWATVLLSTCARSCGGGEGVAYYAEAVDVACSEEGEALRRLLAASEAAGAD